MLALTISRNASVVRVLALALAWPISAGQPSHTIRLVWQVELGRYIGELPDVHGGRHFIGGIAFSPDEASIAVSAGEHLRDRKSLSHLVVLDRRAPTAVVRPFDYEGYPSERLSWSPDGKWLALRSTSVQIFSSTEGFHCECQRPPNWLVKEIGGFLGSNLVAGYVTSPDLTHGPYESHLAVFDTDCRQTEEVHVGNSKLYSVDVSSRDASDRVAIVFERAPGVVIDWQDRNFADSWLWEPYASSVRFVDDGRAVCVGSASLKSQPARCHLIGQARSSKPPKIGLGSHFYPSEKAPWIAALDVAYSYNGWTEQERFHVKRVIVYDYRTGGIVVGLSPSFQRNPILDSKPAEPFAFALSPSGRFLAEGGDDVVKLYEIE